jgi:hypothetical protein
LLRTEASALGSNLSIVRIRQDFSKNLINVLQAGSSNLTLAETNEEAANSQARSTRQSIAVSALSLANRSQQSCSSRAEPGFEGNDPAGGENPRRFSFQVTGRNHRLLPNSGHNRPSPITIFKGATCTKVKQF